MDSHNPRYYPMDVLQRTDPDVWQAIQAERERQQQGLELIASENYASPAVLAAQGSVLTNKYAEGYPGRRYYGGCENVDTVERLAIDRLLKLFGADRANVQPHSGAQANTAVFFAALQPGDTFLAMDLAHGGHLTHGMKISVSGIRGEVGEFLTPALACAFGQAFGTYIGPGRVVLGRDTRTSGEMLEHAVGCGLLAAGCDVVKIGVLPTPTIQIYVRASGARGGLGITASHNPPEYNALKLFNGDGLFFNSYERSELIDLYHQSEFHHATNAEIGGVTTTGGAVVLGGMKISGDTSRPSRTSVTETLAPAVTPSLTATSVGGGVKMRPPADTSIPPTALPVVAPPTTSVRDPMPTMPMAPIAPASRLEGSAASPERTGAPKETGAAGAAGAAGPA